MRSALIARKSTTVAPMPTAFPHHLCEKLVEHEGFSLSRETLRLLLRQHGSARHVNAALPLIASAACVPPVAVNLETAWRPAPHSLDRICCFVHELIVSNDNVVQWEGRRFQIPSKPAASASPVPKSDLSSSQRATVALLRRHPPGTRSHPRGVTVSRCC
jgi:hypothetical protein